MSFNSFPKVEYVTFETPELPIIGKVKYRPFVMGEYRKMLEVQELKEPAAALELVASTIDACTFGKLQIRQLPMYLLEMLYLEIWKSAKGNVSPLVFTCQAEVTDESGNKSTCGQKVNINLPLDNITLETPALYQETSIIKLSDVAGIKLRQPTIDSFKELKSVDAKDLENAFIYACVESIYDGDRVMLPGKDFDMSGLVEYLDTLDGSVIEQMDVFFRNAPKLTLEQTITCPKCGASETVKFEGLDDFFG